MLKIIRTLAQDSCSSGLGCPSVHETFDDTTETGGLAVQGYTITDQAVLASLGVALRQTAVLLTDLAVEQARDRGVDLSWLRRTPDGRPAAVGTTVPDLAVLLDKPVPADEHAVIPRAPLEAFA